MQEQKPSKKLDSKHVPTFKQIKSDGNIKKLIKSAFDTDLAVSGDWGYTKELATLIEDINDIQHQQLEHMLASMRTYLEMNMTQKEEDRYGSININEVAREQYNENSSTYDKVTYEITAIKEDTYATFINEYKEGYGNASFDLNSHFQRRKEATLTRTETFWFRSSTFNKNASKLV